MSRLMTVCSIRLSSEEQLLLEQYAAMHRTTISNIIRMATIEKIEDELDLEICYRALKNFENDPKTYTFEEIRNELGPL
jgi:predicted DNA-binding protein